MTSKQVRLVLLSYAMRPMNWLFLFVGLCFLMLSVGIGGSPNYQSCTPIKRSWSNPEFLSEGYELEWDWNGKNLEADRWWLNAGPGIPWERLSQLKNLRQLDLSRYENVISSKDTEFVRIAELPNLEHLELPATELDTELSTALGKLGKLEWLNAYQLESGGELLPVLPELHTLEIRIESLSPELVAYLHKLPKLHTLILRDELNPSSDGRYLGWAERFQYTDADTEVIDLVSQLDDIKSLKRLYLPGREFDNLELAAVSALPTVRVQPLCIDFFRKWTLDFAIIGCCMLALIPGLAMFGQFTRPESILTPRYRGPHLAVAVSLLVLTVLLGSWAASISNISAPTAGCLIVFGLGLASTLVTSNVSTWLRYLVTFGGAIYIFVPNLAATHIRTLLYGEAPIIIPLVLLIAGIGLLAHTTNYALQHHRRLAELGVSFPMLTTKDQIAASAALNAKRVEEKGWPWIANLFKPNEAAFGELSQTDFHAHQPAARQKLLALPSSTLGTNRV